MNEVIEVKPISTDAAKEFQPRINNLEIRIKNLVIKNSEDLEECANIVRQVDGFKDALNEKRMGITRPIDAAKAAVMALFKPSVEKCEELSKIGRSKHQTFMDEQERQRKERQRKLDEEAEKKAAAERKKLEDKATAAAAKGNTAKADELREQASSVQAAPVIAAPTVAPAAGTAQVTRWKYRVTDLKSVPRDYMIPNDEMLSKQAVATKNTLAIPGIEFYPETTTAFKKK